MNVSVTVRIVIDASKGRRPLLCTLGAHICLCYVLHFLQGINIYHINNINYVLSRRATTPDEGIDSAPENNLTYPLMRKGTSYI